MLSQLDPQLTLLLKNEIVKHKLPNHFLNSIQQWIMPIAESISQYQLNKKKPIIISFNGAQGSGKSTITHFIALLLTHHFKQRSINISLDDFYLGKQQRNQLSQQVHPLLKTRGVPGTHDLALAISTLTRLSNCSSQIPCFIPQFNKAVDDQAPKNEWIKIEEPIDIILFEGWCNHAPIQNEDELNNALNILEQQEDPSGIWRCYVNDQLKIYHQQLFSLCDYLYFIKIPSFNMVYEWRGLQENKLEESSQASTTMDQQDLIRFIQHFERLTRQCLQSLPNIADTVIELDDNHQIKAIVTN